MLLRLAGVGLAAGPLPALAASEGGPPAASMGPGPIWTEFFKGQRIWAYADRLSLKPGEPLNVMAAAGPGMPTRRVRLEVFRLGATGLMPIWTSDFADVAYRGATASAKSLVQTGARPAAPRRKTSRRTRRVGMPGPAAAITFSGSPGFRLSRSA